MKTHQMIDVVEPEVVEVQISNDGKTVWVNIEGICALRCNRIGAFILTDERKETVNQDE